MVGKAREDVVVVLSGSTEKRSDGRVVANSRRTHAKEKYEARPTVRKT